MGISYNIIEGGEGALGRVPTQEQRDKVGNIWRGKNKQRDKVVFQYDLHGRVVSKYSSAKEATNVIGVSSNTISKACRGLIKSLRGFIFMYEDCGEEPLY